MREHIIVYREKGCWAATPANYGIWHWNRSNSSAGIDGVDEIVVGFVVGRLQKDGGYHARSVDTPYVTMQARSVDGGRAWDALRIPCRIPVNRSSFSADEHMRPDLRLRDPAAPGVIHAPQPCCGGIDFTYPGFALMCAKTGLGKGTVSWFYTSLDRCRSWDGPYRIPLFGLAGVEARTDYLVSNAGECLFFLTAAKDGGGEGRGVFCVRATDGGRELRFQSWVVQSGEGYAIMPASVRLSPSSILVAVRRRDGVLDTAKSRCWIDLFASNDDAGTWEYLGTPVQDTGIGGNPPTLTCLRDGRLCITYAYRSHPAGHAGPHQRRSRYVLERRDYPP